MKRYFAQHRIIANCKSALQIDQCNTTFTKTPRVVNNGDISGHASTGLAARGQCQTRQDRIRACLRNTNVRRHRKSLWFYGGCVSNLSSTTWNAYEFVSPIGQCNSSLDPSAELSKLGELILGTAEADKDDSAALPDLQVDAPGDSPTGEPSQESSPGEVQGQGLVSQSLVS